MLSGSGEWAFLDVNSESSHYWGLEVQSSVGLTYGSGSQPLYSGSEGSFNLDAGSYSGTVYPSPAGSTVKWGGGQIFMFQDAGIGYGCANSASITLSTDIDFRNRNIYLLDGMVYNTYNLLPGGEFINSDQGDETSGGVVNTEFGRKCFWTGTGSDGFHATGEPKGAYLKLTVAQSSDCRTIGYLYVHSSSHALCFYNTLDSAVIDPVYSMFTFMVSDQYPERY